MESRSLGALPGECDSSTTEDEWCSHKHLMLHDLNGTLEGGTRDAWEDLDGEIWGKLPEDVLERVLLKLPVRCLCRFRSVCKRWLSLLSSQSFLRCCYPATPCISAFEVLSSWEEWPREWCGGLVSSSVYKVYRIDLSFLPKKIFSVATSHKGLICFSTYPKNCNTVSLCVCNPITRVWKALPEFTIPVTHGWESAMVVDDSSNAFRVIVISDEMFVSDSENESAWTLHEYSSDRDVWRIIQGDNSRDTFFGGAFLLSGELMYSVDDVEVQLYSTVAGKVVRKLEVETPAETFFHARLMEHYGEVLLVGDIMAYSGSTVGIWKLDQTNAVWDRVSVFPEVQLSEMARDWVLINSLTVGHFICVEIEVYQLNKKVGLQYVLAFNTREDSWHTFPMKSVRERSESVARQEDFWNSWNSYPLRRVRDKGLTLIEPRLDVFI